MSERRIVGFRRALRPYLSLREMWIDQWGNVQPAAVEPIYEGDKDAPPQDEQDSAPAE